MDLKDFMSFVLTPLAATLLIAEDKSLTLEFASSVRDASNAFGDLMQPDIDEDAIIDDLHRKNIRAMKDSPNVLLSQPPCHRKPSLTMWSTKAQAKSETNQGNDYNRRFLRATTTSLYLKKRKKRESQPLQAAAHGNDDIFLP
ncbi:hypothetical protein B0H11DRAFT_1911727 [Mycena galericulata]|nr:hypothetical protein B0H11DRAFT_1911727 [Mycena galericulata]